MDKDIELQKISVFDGYLQAKINAKYSMLVAEAVGLTIFVATLYFEGVFGQTLLTYPFYIFGLLLVLALIYRHNKKINKTHDGYLSLTCKLLDKVEKGESLPPIHDLKRMADKKEY